MGGKRVILSGGGTGGHIYPAIAVAEELRSRGIQDILFVGAHGKLEMTKVPQSGFEIKGLSIAGFDRSRLWRNWNFPFKLIKSMLDAKNIINEFKPDVVIGFGGYASGPVLRAAQSKSIPTYLQEQNSYPGVTNRLLAKKAKAVFVAYDKLDEYFSGVDLIHTGNPLRASINLVSVEQLSEAYAHFGLDADKSTIFLFGGSGGAKSMNDAMESAELLINEEGVQVLWQTGKYYYEKYKDTAVANLEHVKIVPYIERMDYAYSIADLVVCRAGALAISEVARLERAVILVPSAHVAGNHQFKNAQALKNKNAALLVSDEEASSLVGQMLEVIQDTDLLNSLKANIKQFSTDDAARTIVDYILMERSA